MSQLVQVTRPDPSVATPVLISVPHAGTRIPQDERQLYRATEDELLTDPDLYVDELYAGIHELGATLISSPWSRFVVDLNRFHDDLHPSAVRGTTERQGAGYFGLRGVIAALTTRGVTIYKQPLRRELFKQRLARYYWPYHEAIKLELTKLRTKFGRAVLLDAHSMPSRATTLHSDPGELRADIVPGDLDGTSCSSWLTDLTSGHWRAAGYTVKENTPYKGGAITRLYGKTGAGFDAIQLEINRALYMDEHNRELRDGLNHLRQTIRGWVSAVGAQS